VIFFGFKAFPTVFVKDLFVMRGDQRGDPDRCHFTQRVCSFAFTNTTGSGFERGGRELKY
jgi:hypothetical protein